MKNHSFTIITIVKNDEENIEKTIKSVIVNKKKNVEYVIIDGKSSDKTLKKINRYKKYIDKLVSEKDGGIYDAMNKGIRISTNNIIVFCNSGDFFYKNAINKIEYLFKKKMLIMFLEQ